MDLYANGIRLYNTKMTGVYIWSSGVGWAAATGVYYLLEMAMPNLYPMDPVSNLLGAAALCAIGIPIDLIGGSKLKKLAKTQHGIEFSLNF